MEIQLFIRKKHLNLLRTFEKPKRISPQIMNLKVCKYRKNNSKCQFSRNFLFLVPIYKHLYISYVCMDRTNSWCYFLINFGFFLDLDGKPEFSPEMRNNSKSDELAELEHELELELEHELEIELKLELELAELARKFFNIIACLFKLIKPLLPFW